MSPLIFVAGTRQSGNPRIDDRHSCAGWNPVFRLTGALDIALDSRLRGNDSLKVF